VGGRLRHSLSGVRSLRSLSSPPKVNIVASGSGVSGHNRDWRLAISEAGYACDVEDAAKPGFIAAHVQYVRERSGSEAEQFTRLMLRWAWPSGHDDRFDPAAVAWPRQWSAAAGPGGASCGCVAGRCTVCN